MAQEKAPLLLSMDVAGSRVAVDLALDRGQIGGTVRGFIETASPAEATALRTALTETRNARVGAFSKRLYQRGHAAGLKGSAAPAAFPVLI